jgi:uncharacterized membrane protein YidH (DUF202 family)
MTGGRKMGTGMIESHERVEQFKQEIADMKVRDPATGRDRVWLRIGIALMVVGLVLAIAAYFMSRAASTNVGSAGPAEQRDALIVALIGVTTAVVGAAVFLRYSLAAFLRFWLARFVYEQQAQTDRLIDRLK